MSDKKWDEVFYFNINSYQFDNNNNNNKKIGERFCRLLTPSRTNQFTVVSWVVYFKSFQWMLLFLMIFPVGLIKNEGLYL